MTATGAPARYLVSAATLARQFDDPASGKFLPVAELRRLLGAAGVPRHALCRAATVIGRR